LHHGALTGADARRQSGIGRGRAGELHETGTCKAELIENRDRLLRRTGRSRDVCRQFIERRVAQRLRP
jgi:hypothetical protein